MKNPELLKIAKDALDRAMAEKKMNQELIKSLGPAIVETLQPVLEQIAHNSKLNQKDLVDTLSTIKNVSIPEIKVPQPKITIDASDIRIPEIKIPKIEVPKIPKPEITVNIPKIKIPDLEWPKEEMPIKGWVQLMGVDLNNPLPVQLRDSQGNPVAMSQGGGGGGAIRSEVSIKKPRSVKMFNVAILAGDTEYSQQLPEGTKSMTLQNREDNNMRISYEIGRVANSTSAFMTIKGGQFYYETNVDLSSKTVYVASGRTGVAEIVAYY